MAALEKIRKRAAILTIVIGAALLAFILEEGVKAMGSMGNDTTALIVGDEKVDYSEYKQLLDNSPRDQQQKTDESVVRQQMIDNFIEEKLLSQECEEANLLITEEEIANLLQTPLGAPSQIKEAGIDPKVAFEQLKNADPNDKNAQALIAIYDEQTKNLTRGLKTFKLDVAVKGSMQPNNIDLALMKEESTTYTVELASVRYDDYPEKVTVSDAEIKEAYEQFKETFKLDQEKRRISYILVPKEPSQKDKESANVEIEKIFKDLEAYDGISGIRKNKNPHLYIDSIVKSKKAGNDTIINALIAAGKSSLVKRQDPKGKDHTTILYKVINVTACPATVAIDQVAVAGPKAKQDSIMPFLKSGISTDSIAKLFSKDRKVEVTPFTKHNQKITGEQLVNDKSACDSINKYLNTGQFFVIQEEKDVDQPYTIYAKVVEGKDSIVNYYTIARAKYVNKPSEATENALRDKLQSYVDKNNTAADFNKNAAKEKYTIKTAIIDASTAMIGEQMGYNPMTGQPQRMNGVPKSRKAIKWAFDNKQGAVSTEELFEGEDYFMAVALEAVYEDYVPINDPDLKLALTNYVRNKKIGELLKNKCKGKNNMEELANTLNTTVQTLDITPGSENNIDPKVAGRISGLGNKSLNTIQTIAGDNAFFVVKVISKKENPRDLPKQVILKEYLSKNYNLGSMLHSSRKVVNNTLKFE